MKALALLTAVAVTFFSVAASAQNYGAPYGKGKAPPPPPVYYAPEPVYVEEPACRVVRERYWDGYDWMFRRVQVCD